MNQIILKGSGSNLFNLHKLDHEIKFDQKVGPVTFKQPVKETC